jgi:hypothetical protein
MDKVVAVYSEGIGLGVEVYGIKHDIEDYAVASLNGGEKKECIIYVNIAEVGDYHYFDIDGVTVPLDECIRV